MPGSCARSTIFLCFLDRKCPFPQRIALRSCQVIPKPCGLLLKQSFRFLARQPRTSVFCSPLLRSRTFREASWGCPNASSSFFGAASRSSRGANEWLMLLLQNDDVYLLRLSAILVEAISRPQNWTVKPSEMEPGPAQQGCSFCKTSHFDFTHLTLHCDMNKPTPGGVGFQKTCVAASEILGEVSGFSS